MTTVNTSCSLSKTVPFAWLLNHTPIVCWMKSSDPCSRILFQACMSEEEGKQIIADAEADHYQCACRLFRKYFRGEESDKGYAEAGGVEAADGQTRCLLISKVVPDDWLNECKQIMSRMLTYMRGVLTLEREEEVW